MAATKTTTPTAPAKPKRLVLDVPPATHRALKMRAAAEGRTIREVVLDALAAQGIGEPAERPAEG